MLSHVYYGQLLIIGHQGVQANETCSIVFFCLSPWTASPIEFRPNRDVHLLISSAVEALI